MAHLGNRRCPQIFFLLPRFRRAAYPWLPWTGQDKKLVQCEMRSSLTIDNDIFPNSDYYFIPMTGGLKKVKSVGICCDVVKVMMLYKQREKKRNRKKKRKFRK